MPVPRPPLRPDKLRRTRLLLVLITVALLVGCVVEEAAGRGLWTLGLVGWAAIVAAVVLGAGRDNTLTVLGLAAPARRLRARLSAPDSRRNDADWS